MDSFKKILFTSLVALSSSVHANTAPLDLYVNWTGAYVGAYFGAGSGNADTKFHANGLSAVNQIVFSSTETQIGTISQAGRLHGNVTGSIADLFAGFNYHFACTPWLLGAQVEGSFFSDITDKTVGTENENTATAVISFTPPFVTSNTTRTTASATANVYDELTSMFKLVGRVGYIIDPSTMIYILGGGVAGNWVMPASEDFNGVKRNKWIGGYTVGAGVEYMFNGHWSLRAEYRYLNFDVDRASTNSSVASTQNGDIPNAIFINSISTFSRSAKTSFNDNLGEIGIVYRI